MVETHEWENLGISLRAHAIGHGGGENGKTSDKLLRQIRGFPAERIAALAKKLDAVKEGDGTVLDGDHREKFGNEDFTLDTDSTTGPLAEILA